MKEHILSHIVAASENNIIGKDNGLPWKLPADFAYFKNKTWGLPVIMGSGTYESLQHELPGRTIIVLTRNENFEAPGVLVATSISKALDMAKDAEAKEIFIIGGGRVFEETMHIVDRIYLTRVHTTVEGDTSYPALDENVWRRVSALDHPADEKNKFAFTFEVWERK